MTTQPFDPVRPDTALSPPPGCPAHAGPGGVTRLFGPGYEADPLRVFERLRAEHGAVAPVLLTGDLPGWLVLGYREILEVVRTPTRFSHDSRHWHQLKEGKVAADNPLLPVIGARPDRMTADGDEHRRLRDAVNDCLDRFDRRGVRRHVTHFANQLIDEFSRDGRAELLDQFARQLPMAVLTQLLGMPEAYSPRLVDAATELVKASDKAIASNDFIKEQLAGLLARKKERPSSDLASWLIEHPAGLSDDEIRNLLWLVLMAANENTTSLLASTLRMVLTDQRFRASLAGGQMTLPDAVEQVLWDDPPTIVIPARWATADTELAGRPIRAGDMLLLGVAAGNIDPAVRPDLNAPMHGNRSHLSFSGGPHECPGREIARAIADTAIDALLLRLPDLRLAVPEGELRWRATTWTRHLVALPVEFAPRPPVGDALPERAGLLPPRRPLPEPRISTPKPPAAVEPAEPPVEPRHTWWDAVKGWFGGQ
ncbi:cytochrome P450 [Streptomyces palmae]|uniref:Cytochrome P450 n=1 Tax=Streptomyces palmae TaxID=1701085 RepID=A0A4Z0GBL9_9ACTN|nr:cytochrome P450 [Streptomyces palmae]TGA91851.1 cytochrome P450 [Streptomyces palmae]